MTGVNHQSTEQTFLHMRCPQTPAEAHRHVTEVLGIILPQQSAYTQ